MTKTLTTKFGIRDRQAAFVLTLLVLAFIVMNLTQDFLRSNFKKSPFYFSEALIFSSFWWLFAPLLFAQYFVVNYKKKKLLTFKIVVIILPIFFHLFAFPFLVWVLSTAFYYHVYSFQQTFSYTLSEYLYILVLLYSIPILTFHFFLKKSELMAAVPQTQSVAISTEFISTLIVTSGKQKQQIMVSEIFYLSANPPYINIHLQGKNYLQNETLKSISIKLNPAQFVRIHKASIVNIKMVASYTTRLNGDYDLTMKNNFKLRISRNYATNFKNLFNKTHHFTVK